MTCQKKYENLIYPFGNILEVARIIPNFVFLIFQGLLGWGYYLIMLPFRFTYYTILDIFRYVSLYLCTNNHRVA